ncbi:DNA methyltransferase family protein [Halobacillus amylolyticus]|uniref:Methylase n=1 Tax=Halobacillus amylolyticus TaxID=2932259 RepID=A0ABY4H6W6_9BACI|nr:methylase [Halobacillus amylolyticus]UOR10261.1 methylase [Halobacillus amylolyticus]
MEETVIKCKLRVQKHGEVFTPKKIIKKMLDIKGVKEACESLPTTFLEPSAGEGAFLVAILERKLKIVIKHYNDDLVRFENYSLLALTSLYGIELLEDNAQTCVLNMFQVYYDIYQEQVQLHNGKLKKKVLDSAKEIISSNIRQGNFLTRETIDGNPLVFSEWSPINMKKTTKNIKIQRTEYTLDEIYENVEKESGKAINRSINKTTQQQKQLDMFDLLEEDVVESENEIPKEMRYIPVNIIDVYKSEMEEADG